MLLRQKLRWKKDVLMRGESGYFLNFCVWERNREMKFFIGICYFLIWLQVFIFWLQISLIRHLRFSSRSWIGSTSFPIERKKHTSSPISQFTLVPDSPTKYLKILSLLKSQSNEIESWGCGGEKGNMILSNYFVIFWVKLSVCLLLMHSNFLIRIPLDLIFIQESI